MDERVKFITENLGSVMKNAKVWDFCCGTGMNGLTALELGANHVLFTDVREESFNKWISDNKIILRDDQYTWEYLDADILDINKLNTDIDIILYHGHFYHARNHFELIKMLSSTTAKHLLFESKGSDSLDPSINWYHEPMTEDTQTYYEDAINGLGFCGGPTLGFCHDIFKVFGWTLNKETLYKWYFPNSENFTWKFRFYLTRNL